MSKLDEYLVDYKNPFVKLKKIGRTFFFDESNNIKKGRIGAERDNVSDLEHLCFVLGGIASREEINFEELLKFVGARQTPIDAKFSFFSFKHTKFMETIKQPRLRKFFEYLLTNDILIHFDVLHYMYFAIVDILDSLIQEDDVNQKATFMCYLPLQSAMTEVLYCDYSLLHDIFCRYEFPNIPTNKANEFVKEILELYTDNLQYFDMDDIDNFPKELLRQIIKAKRNQTNMYFLEDNISFEISSGVFTNYLLRMMEIRDKKCFDNEQSIVNELQAMDEKYKEKLNVTFDDSKNNRNIQICDVICGFVARLYTFLGKNSLEDIITFASNLKCEDEEYKTLKVFFDLMTKSDKEYNVMLKKTVPLFIEYRFTMLCKIIENK